MKDKYVSHYSRTGELINEEPRDIKDYLAEFYDTLGTSANEMNDKQYNVEWNLMWFEVMRYLSNYAHLDPNPLPALIKEFKKLQK